MATVDMPLTAQAADAAKANVLQCTLTGAVVLTVMFVTCWAAAALNFTASHMYISLFTIAPVASLRALAVGVCWSILIGGLTGALIAVTFNAFAFVGRRA